MEGVGDNAWRFELSWPKGQMRLSTWLDLGGAILMGTIAYEAVRLALTDAFIIAVVAAAAFALGALTHWRRLRSTRKPLVLDHEGVSVDDGLGDQWFVPWQKIEQVRVQRGFIRRWVVLLTRDEEHRLRIVPAAVYRSLPPQGLAGVIETFREHFVRR